MGRGYVNILVPSSCNRATNCNRRAVSGVIIAMKEISFSLCSPCVWEHSTVEVHHFVSEAPH